MPRLDRQMFQELSSKTSFQVDLLEKIYRLTELLNELNRTDLKDKLILKGGTAINFIYFDLPRLSVDIDFDYINSNKKDQMLSDREDIETTLKKIFSTLDYSPEKSKSYALDKYNLYYNNSVNNRDRIKLEINYLKRATILEPIDMKFEHLFEINVFKILTLELEELFGRKLGALVRRTTPKDLYDIYKLINSDLKYNENIMKECFIFSLCLDGDPRDIDFDIFNELMPRDIWTSLTPIIRKEENLDLKMMKKDVEPFLNRMIDFSEKEHRFIRTLYDEGEYDLDILFCNHTYNKKLKEHPGIKWRLKNL
ncbi:MAG: nucleotidyl transferase AbiEii/AbiGii toxin family protein [archaeon]